MKSMKEEKWKDKALHGQYPKILEKPHVDTVTTNKWLSSNLKHSKLSGMVMKPVRLLCYMFLWT